MKPYSCKIETNEPIQNQSVGSFDPVILRQLAEVWRARHKQIIESADNNDECGNSNAARQNRSQAFGVKGCIEDLEALLPINK